MSNNTAEMSAVPQIMAGLLIWRKRMEWSSRVHPQDMITVLMVYQYDSWYTMHRCYAPITKPTPKINQTITESSMYHAGGERQRGAGPQWPSAAAAALPVRPTCIGGSGAARGSTPGMPACPKLLLLLPLVSGAATGGGSYDADHTSSYGIPDSSHVSEGTLAGQTLSADCSNNVTESACASILRNTLYHPGWENGGLVACAGEHASGGHTQQCTRRHECTTCGHVRCLWCLSSETKALYSEPMGVKFLFVVVSLLCGAATSTLLEQLPRTAFHPPFTVIMFLVGALMGYLAQHNYLGCATSDSVNAWKHQDPHSILYFLLPPLLFESAFNVNYHVFTKVRMSSIILASSGVLVSVGLASLLAKWFFSDELELLQYYNPQCTQYTASSSDTSTHRRQLGGDTSTETDKYDCSLDSWFAALMWGAIVSATDPVAVVAVLQTLGAQPKLSHLIEGESLLNDGTAVVLFLLFKGLLEHDIQDPDPAVAVGKILFLVLRLAGGAIVLGLAFSHAIYGWLRASRNLTANIEISVLVLSVYVVFYVSEHVFGASGVLATVVFGLNLAKRRHLAMSVATEEQNEVVWEEISYIANAFTFALAGVIFYRIVFEDKAGASVADGLGSQEFDRPKQFAYAVAIYFFLALIRLGTIFMHLPLMNKCTKQGYRIKPKEALFMTYSGLRGAVSLCVALFVDHMDLPQVVKDVLIFHTCLCVFFTVFVNGITAGFVYKFLNLGKQGTLSREIDFNTIEKINMRLDKFINGPAVRGHMPPLREHWFHGAHNTDNTATMHKDRSLPKKDGLDLVLSMLQIKMTPKGQAEKSAFSTHGNLQIASVSIRKIWDRQLMRTARREWRKWSLCRCDEQAFTNEDIQHVRQVHYQHEHDNEGGEGEDHLITASDRTSTNPRASQLRSSQLSRLAGHPSEHTKFLGVLKQYTEKVENDGHRDLYNIYLTALRAHYSEEREENKLTATTCDYLQRAISVGADQLKMSEQKFRKKPEPKGFWFRPENRVIMNSHKELVNIINGFNLERHWSAPPIHKIAILTEAFYAEFEAHEAVQQYLHQHLMEMPEMHERIRLECKEVAELALTELAKRNMQQHPLMAPIHTFLAFRECYLYMKTELKDFRVHGLISEGCASQVNDILDERYQDFLSVFSNDGITGQWIVLREWWFRSCCSAMGGRVEKFKANVASNEVIALEKQQHRERLGAIRAFDSRRVRAPTIAPAEIVLQTFYGGDEASNWPISSTTTTAAAGAEGEEESSTAPSGGGSEEGTGGGGSGAGWSRVPIPSDVLHHPSVIKAAIQARRERLYQTAGPSSSPAKP